MTQINPCQVGRLEGFICAHLSRRGCATPPQARQKRCANTLKRDLIAKENQMKTILITGSTIALMVASDVLRHARNWFCAAARYRAILVKQCPKPTPETRNSRVINRLNAGLLPLGNHPVHVIAERYMPDHDVAFALKKGQVFGDEA